ncbi:MAG: hypothetical protein ISR45_05490 [Rhodospirillales bacterium]|nr:hypothetical protein [Rhodospirillales bacterium]
MNHIKGLLGAMALLLAVFAASAPATAGQDGVPLPTPAKAFKGEKCVEPADVMRREHMEFLNHQRDETLREGIRGNKYSLQQCIDCHAVADPKIAGGKVRTLKPFCAECHSYAAVSLDCFSCHNPTAPLETTGSMENLPLQKMIAAHLKDAGADQ